MDCLRQWLSEHRDKPLPPDLQAYLQDVLLWARWQIGRPWDRERIQYQRWCAVREGIKDGLKFEDALEHAVKKLASEPVTRWDRRDEARLPDRAGYARPVAATTAITATLRLKTLQFCPRKYLARENPSPSLVSISVCTRLQMSTKSAGEGKLIPDRLVAERYAVARARWRGGTRSPGLEFPKPIYIRRRRYREIGKLDAWERAKARKAVAAHNPHRDVAQALPRARAGRFTKPRDIEAR